MKSTQDPALTIRALTAADIPTALRLSTLANWNQTESDWRSLLSFEPHGCFMAELNGAHVGTATTTRFIPARGPGSFGWIGMMLVDPAHRRRGIGSALFEKCIAYLEDAGVETIRLDATYLGKKVYDAFGFHDEYTLERWHGAAPALAPRHPSACAIAPLSATELNELAAFDAPIFGAQRSLVLQAWHDAWPECTLAARVNGALAGYTLARRGARCNQIGPVIGRTPEICEALLCDALARQNGAFVAIDLVAGSRRTTEIAQRLGLQMQRPFTRMFRGPNASPGQMENVLAICGPELG